MTAYHRSMVEALKSHRPGYGLARAFLTDPGYFALELTHIFEKEWLFAGHSCEVRQPGEWFTLQVGSFPVVVVRGDDGKTRAFHNVCRHRGFRLCEGLSGKTGRRLTCPYHQWTYELDGRFARARDMGAEFNPDSLGLKAVHCESIAGYIFICLAETPPDFGPFRTLLGAYAEPFDLANAKIAFESRIVEKGNWKIVWDNNRECYHCRGSHPELCHTFPETPAHSGQADPAAEARIRALVESCEALGLPSRFKLAENEQFRFMRLPLEGNARSMTMTGEPAVGKRLGRCPDDENIGDAICFHFPTTWNHWTADHALTFRMLPVSPNETELVTRWLVPKDAVEGQDYDLKTLTDVWLATNDQDRVLVERTQAGVNSPAFEPGPLSEIQEDGVIQFINWYRRTMLDRLGGPAMRVAAE